MSKKSDKLLFGILLAAVLSFETGCVKATPIESTEEITPSPTHSESEIGAVENTSPSPDALKESDNNQSGESVYDNYIKFIKANMNDDNFMASDGDSCYILNSSFAFEDINGDGYKDVILCGYLGLRCKQFSKVYMYNNGEYVYIPQIEGMIHGIGDKLLFTTDWDYYGGGEMQYEGAGIYSVNENGTLDEKALYYSDMSVYNEETQEFDEDNPVFITEKYYIDCVECSKDEYDAAVSSYVCTKELEYYELTSENIDNIIK